MLPNTDDCRLLAEQMGGAGIVLTDHSEMKTLIVEWLGITTSARNAGIGTCTTPPSPPPPSGRKS